MNQITEITIKKSAIDESIALDMRTEVSVNMNYYDLGASIVVTTPKVKQGNNATDLIKSP